MYNGCGTINYTGAAVWTFIPAAAGAVGYAWVCTLPEVILLANSKYYFYNGTIAVQGNLNIGDLVYSENIGAYSRASSTWFNGFPPAKVCHVNVT